jgi:hypothetical protein
MIARALRRMLQLNTERAAVDSFAIAATVLLYRY